MKLLVLVLLTLPYLGYKSLWLDEAWVANVIVAGTFDPHSLNTTPIGFALLVRLLVQATPDTEFTAAALRRCSG